MSAPGRGMVLPPHEAATGEVDHGFPIGSRDVRVPRPVGRFGDHSVTALGYYLRDDERCPGARHLWDVLESVAERYVEDDDASRGERVEQDFRATLTCVRCGLVQEWEGVRQEPKTVRVDPTPMRAGDLVAQQISGTSLGWNGRDLSRWAVHDRHTGAQVGTVAWARGPRGRAFFQACFHDDDGFPEGEIVEAPTAEGALRKLAKRAAAERSDRVAV